MVLPHFSDKFRERHFRYWAVKELKEPPYRREDVVCRVRRYDAIVLPPICKRSTYRLIALSFRMMS